LKRQRALVLFDAVGTVIKPNPDINLVYQLLGMLHGSSLSVDEIKQRISAARQKYFHVGMSANTLFENSETKPGSLDELQELESSEGLERGLWQQLVFDVFSDVDSRSELFEQLWSHFAQAENWELYPDVAACWNTLRQHGIEVGLASNFDSRLTGIVNSIPEIAEADYLFCSSQLGFRKPSPLFYRQIEAAINCVSTEERAGGQKIVMVGDDFENDCVAPRLAGWSAVWLNRNRHERTEPVSSSANEVVSLAEFTDWVLATIG
jgi:putative hydrolase of the HAD superfamily